MSRTRFALLALLAAPLAAFAQAYPSKRIKLVVPYPPGGSTDLLGRTVALRMAENMGQNVVVDNRGGAGGMLGSDLVAFRRIVQASGSRPE